MSDAIELSALIQSRIPLVVIETREEIRAMGLLRQVATRLQIPLFKWSVTEGLHRQEEGYQPQRHNIRPRDILAHIKAAKTRGIFLLIDFHPYLDDPTNLRLLKEVLHSAEAHGQTIVFLSYCLTLPAEINHFSAHFKLPHPDLDGLRKIVMEELAGITRQQGGRMPAIEKGSLEALIMNLQGLSRAEARRLARRAVFNDGALSRADLPEVLREKIRILSKQGVLSLEVDTARYADIGGLENLKRWLSKRRRVFQTDSNPHRLPPPKGIMLLGVQGCGKSMAAKVVAGAWDVPLVRLDLGAIYNKFYGESERNIRESLQTAEALAPCVLWLDEVEKGLGTSLDDGGTSKRVLGTLLTWMAERQGRVFIVATANDIQSLPPELVRKGRLDEIFFVDLPDPSVRRAIFSIHLRKRSLDPERFDLAPLVAASEGFSGAEIEQAVVAGLYSVQGGEGQLDTATLLQELEATRPLSVVMAEKISGLRAWAEGRTVPA